MISYMNSNPQEFEEAINLALSDRQPYSWRAAWLLCSCLEKNDSRIINYVKEILNVILEKNDNIQREFLKILYFMDLEDEYEGILFNICITIWEMTYKQPSVRYNAFRIIVKSAKKHPELANEVKYLTQEQYLDSLSPGAQRSVIKMLNELNNFYQKCSAKTTKSQKKRQH